MERKSRLPKALLSSLYSGDNDKSFSLPHFEISRYSACSKTLEREIDSAHNKGGRRNKNLGHARIGDGSGEPNLGHRRRSSKPVSGLLVSLRPRRPRRIAPSATRRVPAVRLRCNGVNPDEHSVKSELERLSLYQDKLESFIHLSNAPVRPSTTLNYQAATCFIEHSLPELTPEQRQSMRDISREEGKKMKYVETNVEKKWKYQSTEKKSVQSTAKEFLEKAARELLGDNNDSFKGPLQAETSEDDEEEEDPVMG